MQAELFKENYLVNVALSPYEQDQLTRIARRLGLTEAAAVRFLIAHYNA
jgi:hypothetical protein